MISKPLSIQAHRSGKRVPYRNHTDLDSVISDPEVEWILISPEEDSEPEITPDEQLLGSFDLLAYETDPLFQWLWSRTSPRLAACLGITAPMMVRVSVLENLSDPQELPIDLSLLRDLARTNARFGTISKEPLSDRVGPRTELRSPIPERESDAPDWLRKEILNMSESDLVPDATSMVDALAVKSGVLLMHDFLEASHSISQSIEGEGLNQNGDYWHAIMHRREPDFGNSKYWFRRVGSHPVFSQLASISRDVVENSDSPVIREWAHRILSPRWDPVAFVDLCEEVHEPNRQGSELHEFVEQIQMREMMLLLRQSWEDALSQG